MAHFSCSGQLNHFLTKKHINRNKWNSIFFIWQSICVKEINQGTSLDPWRGKIFLILILNSILKSILFTFHAQLFLFYWVTLFLFFFPYSFLSLSPFLSFSFSIFCRHWRNRVTFVAFRRRSCIFISNVRIKFPSYFPSWCISLSCSFCSLLSIAPCHFG